MEHAWLDSLSEDWVSQPDADGSPVHLPPLKPSRKPDPSPSPRPPSRIPRWTPGTKSFLPSPNDNSPSILSERSANDINIARQRLSSKLSHERKVSRSGIPSRSASAGTSGSVVHNTVQQKTSPKDDEDETPEWKRRLIYGEIQYGEQRDLFSSAAIGLQDMFKPPQPSEGKRDTNDFTELYETTMPSSPPFYNNAAVDPEMEGEFNLDEDDEADHSDQATPSPSPRRPQREVKFKRNLGDSLDSSMISSGSVRRLATTKPVQDEFTHQDQSCLSVPLHEETTSRKVSGQSDIRNEDFSPILIGKHSDVDGNVDFTPLEIPADQLRQRLERLRDNQMLLDQHTDSPAHFDNDDIETSLIVETTDGYRRNGDFINLRQGGGSDEESFPHRELSTDLGVDSSEMLPEESLQASTPKQFPTVRMERPNPFHSDISLKSPAIPRAPFPSPEKRQRRDTTATTQSGGSPLKLFGPYDTFTNQTLLRRISQFEEGMSGRTSRQSSVPTTRGELKRQIPRKQPLTKSRTVSRFGAGDFEGYEFESSDLSHSSVDDSVLPGKDDISPRPPFSAFAALNLGPPGSSPDDESLLRVRRRRNKPHAFGGADYDEDVTMSSQLSVIPPTEAPCMTGGSKRDSGSEAKRPRTSPSKDPTPKRRRTLHRSDIAFGNLEQLAVVNAAHQKIQRVMGKQQKEGPSVLVEADPEVLAQRPILRARIPSSVRGPSQQREQQASVSLQQRPSHGESRRSPTRVAQNEHKKEKEKEKEKDAAVEPERKPSMRTQDFVDQAAQIMAMIRNQVSQPGLASLEESEVENVLAGQADAAEDSDASTAEPFDRPPSRDGKPVSRFPQRQEDPELVKRLKKYQELSDMGDIISSSVRSMGLAKDAIRAAQEIERMIEEASRARAAGSVAMEGEVISDIPNVCISTNPESADESADHVDDFPSYSSDRSTSRTYPTGSSSRGSESRKVIMPQSVSHLIPDRIGGMYLDKQNNIWIKKKETKPDAASNVAPSEDSDDDPFASIPDLTVDMTKELQQLKLDLGNRDDAADGNNRGGSFEASSPRDTHRGYMNMALDEAGDPGMAARAQGEIEKLGPRATKSAAPHGGVESDTNARDDRAGNLTSTARRRNLTISFSSPIASVIHDVFPEDLDSLEDDPELGEAMGSGSVTPAGSPLQTPAAQPCLRNPGHMSMRSNRGTQQHGSMRASTFIPRPVSRIDEQDEESTVEIPVTHQNDRQLGIIGDGTLISHRSADVSFGFIINQTPGHNSIAVPPDDSLLIGQNVGRLSLSPLSEFTLNQVDRSFGFEVSYVMGPRHMATGDGSKKVLSMTIRELVDKLAEVEPLEAYWEDMTELDLNDKRLTSLHMLDEFCGKVTTLDASRNTLGHLDGVPACVRQLKVSNNRLTELTSWDHLLNLQYVDISGNEVKSLSALKNLVHLRSLRADNNQLRSLDGLDCHDGLLTLRARDNLIERLDCADMRLGRLTELDLGSNDISSVRNLEMLPALSRLNLSKNQLRTLTFTKAIKTLRQLDVGDNELTSLDIRNLPNLHTLHADRNRIHDLSGFRYARRMDSLSLREQRGETPLDLGFLASACEIRKLFLSGNYLGSFEPRADFLNLQLLELANCGLQNLAAEVGQLMPNLRTLNLNFNAISDLSPLRFIPRLKKLLVAGNRLMDSTSVTELLTGFPHLTQLDLRDNPITQGFYSPMQLLVTTDKAECADPFTLPDAEAERDATFARRLDEPTKLRRRLHEVVFVASCKRLRELDGLRVRRGDVLARDGLLQTLVDEGLVPELNDTLVEESESTRKGAAQGIGVAGGGDGGDDGEEEETAGPSSEALNSSRWNAEDSFA